MTIPIDDGIYVIRSYKDINQVLDVTGRSTSSGANVLLHAPNGGDTVGNHEKFLFISDVNDTCLVRPVHCSWSMYLGAKGTTSGSNVYQNTDGNIDRNHWILTKDTTRTITYNGVTLNPYKIANAANTNLVIDAENGQTKDGTNIRVYTSNDTDAQRWILTKDCEYMGGAVPANVGVSYTDGGTRLTELLTTTNSVSFYPTWLCDASKFQLRYRTRSYDGQDYTSWSSWKSPTDSMADEGYGNVWTNNETVSATTLQKWGSQLTLSSLDWTTYIRYEMQLSVRRFCDDTSWTPYDYGSGASCVQAIKINKTPEITCSSVQMTNKGIKFNLTGTPVNTKTSWKLESVKVGTNLVCNDAEWQGSNGTYLLTWDNLLYLPADGSKIKFNVTFDNTETVKTVKFSNIDVDYDGGTLAISASLAYSDTKATVSVTTTTTSKVYILRWKHHGVYEAALVDATFNPPFADFDLYIIAENGSVWGTKQLSGTLDCSAMVWDFDEDDIAKAEWISDIDAVTNSFTAEEDDYHFFGKPYHTRYLQDGGDSDCSVSGAIIESDDYDAFERLKNAKYALFRTPDGFRANVVVTGLEMPRNTRDTRSVSIAQKENS